MTSFINYLTSDSFIDFVKIHIISPNAFRVNKSIISIDLVAHFSLTVQIDCFVIKLEVFIQPTALIVLRRLQCFWNGSKS